MPDDECSQERDAPLYQQVELSLRARIRDGLLPVNAMLPSRRELAREYGVSLPTIERAVAVLLADGTLRADDRRGTFVASAPAPAAEPTPRICRCGGQIPAPCEKPRVLGVITTLAPETHDGNLSRQWTTSIIASLEAAFLGNGASARFLDRVQPDCSCLPMEVAIERLVAAGVDALAVVNDEGPAEAHITILERSAVPFVLITEDEVRRPVASVMLDNHSAGYQAALHALQSGHTELLFLAPFTAPCIEERIAGVRDALGNAGLTSRSLHVFPNNPPSLTEVVRDLGWDACTEAARVAASRAMAEALVPSAVIAANDYAAYGVYRAAAENGLTVGHDFVLIGFDDHPNSRFLGLTTLRPPLEAMGREAARLLHASLQGEECYGQVRIRPLLMRRASTCSFHCQRPNAATECWPVKDIDALLNGDVEEVVP